MFKLTFSFVIGLLFSAVLAHAQTCTGALGDPVINIDFDRGTNKFGSPIPETNYRYVAGTPNDGFYTIVQNTANSNTGWHQNVVNHTPNDPNGYFMLVNADFNKGVFYEKTLTGLCPNTTYEFAAWIINILVNPGIKPKVRFTIKNNGAVIGDYVTEDIPEGSATNWIKYGTIFKTPANVGTITLTMTNENPGGDGNDLGLDDITFRACGPTITTSVNNGGNTASICEGTNQTFNIKANVSTGYNDPVYQWQQLFNGNWTNVNGQTNTTATFNYVNAVVGTYSYRLNVSERLNAGSPQCSISSAPVTITVNAKPIATSANDGPKCVGQDVQLTANGGVTYSWTGPNFTSNLQNPILSNVNLTTAGNYTVTVTNANGCTNISQTTVNILPAINATTNFDSQTICPGESVALAASGGTSYSWLPTTGLSNPSIANPIATPLTTTNYVVSISNGTCTTTKSIIINVLENPTANAGTDKKIVAGQKTILDGAYTGDNVTYTWTPNTFLDNPNVLNPTANPPSDMVYTLTVQNGCTSVSDEVFIKVFPKIEITNAFTPNGDGINDTWSIAAMSAFEKPLLTVFTRNGQKVLETSTTIQWDGKFNGKDLPIGAYYYTLSLNDDFKRYSGWVLITR